MVWEAGKGTPMEQDTTPKARRTALSVKRMRSTAIQCLYAMMTDENLKPSDRLSAIKAALDYAGKHEARGAAKANDGDDDVLHVVFENIPQEYVG